VNGTALPPPELRLLTSTLFDPADIVLIRPVETWTEGGRKHSHVLHRLTRHVRAGDVAVSPGWEDYAAAVRAERGNFFFAVAPRFGGGGLFDLAWQIRTLRCLWADVDDAGPDEVVRRCEKMKLPPPTVLVATSVGLPKCHAYWALDQPYLVDDADAPPPAPKEWFARPCGKKLPVRFVASPDGKKVYEHLPHPEKGWEVKRPNPAFPSKLSPKAGSFQCLLKGIAAALGADHTTDLSRLLRLPGTLNLKGARNGAAPRRCELVACDPSRRYPVEAFAHFVVPRAQAPAVAPSFTGRTRTARRGPSKLPDLIQACAGACVTTRSQRDFAFCCQAIRDGLTEEEAWRLVEDVGKFAEQGWRYFDHTWANAKEEVGKAGRPSHQIRERHRRGVIQFTVEV
jgi:hypothetical protein